MHAPHPRTFTVISRRDLSLKSEFKQSNLPSFSTFIAYSGAGNKTKRPDELPRLAIGLYLLTINKRNILANYILSNNNCTSTVLVK